VLLGFAREQNLKKLRAYLERKPRVVTELGYDRVEDIPSYSTLQKEISERLPAELDETGASFERFENAATRAVYAVYRNGTLPPNAVLHAYGFHQANFPLPESRVPRTDAQQATRNWINLLTEKTLDPLTLNRTDPDIKLIQFLGLMASSALTNTGFQSTVDVVDWDLDRESIPKGSGLPKYISNRLSNTEGNEKLDAAPSINQQFDAVHTKTRELAKQLGFFTDPLSLAVDMYKVDWTGHDAAPTIDRPAKSENDVRSEWTFAVISILDNSARFTFGTRLLRSKDRYPASIKAMLSSSPALFDVKAMYADSEIVSGELIDALHQIAGPDWIIKAPNTDLIKTLKSVTT
jgi:hypothetical protein